MKYAMTGIDDRRIKNRKIRNSMGYKKFPEQKPVVQASLSNGQPRDGGWGYPAMAGTGVSGEGHGHQ